MNKTFYKLAIMAIALIGLNCSISLGAQIPSIDNTKEIVIEESLISIGKKYTVKVDGVKVGTIRGKAFQVFGDQFVLTDNQGKIIATETQKKRLLNFNLNREAVVNHDGKISYIRENKQRDFFKVFVISHFYNSKKQQIGTYKRRFSFMRSGKFLDKQGHCEYEFKQKLLSLNDIYTLTIHNNDDIPLIDAIFMVCIQDAINDSIMAKNTKSK